MTNTDNSPVAPSGVGGEQVPVAASERTLTRVVAAAAVGTFVEYYDLAVYGFLASTIASVFFATTDSSTALLSTFAVFSVAFFARPVGGLLWGAVGDRIGRKRTLVIILNTMTVSTVLVGLLPSFDTVGIAAPILLILLRLVQGLSAGGEVTGAAAFIAEYAPHGRRGFLVSWLQVATTAALMTGLLTAALLNAALTPEQMQSWGWRIAFLVALPLGIVGIYIRTKLEETPMFVAVQEAAERTAALPGNVEPEKNSVAVVKRYRQIALAAGIGVVHTLAFYIILSYLPTYLTSDGVGLTKGESYVVLGVATLTYIVLIPATGLFSDRFGRRPSFFIATLGLIAMAMPAFWLMTQGSLGLALVGQIMLVIPGSFAASTMLIAQAEMFPTKVRYTGQGIAVGVVAALFGGSAPFIAQFLRGLTDSLYVPAYMIMFAAAISLIACIRMRETAREALPA
ncbi:MFS transporter, MHS family, proline/betaine transporter [Rhodococcoides kyotonense]|uniref:Putative proline/betaine transporter n=1 Tax=Rhodococcoides kyotonense TaxID=398843 RepID=A0A239M0D7_9NOCA|nr:MFS transporter, MHS family, proline/betaine transporter [Rhodococcus kyotonensis]